MWVFTSKRYRGCREHPPYTEFKIGRMTIAKILMERVGEDWQFTTLSEGYEAVHPTFREALKDLHQQLNTPPDDPLFQTGGHNKRAKEPSS